MTIYDYLKTSANISDKTMIYIKNCDGKTIYYCTKNEIPIYLYKNRIYATCIIGFDEEDLVITEICMHI